MYVFSIDTIYKLRPSTVIFIFVFDNVEGVSVCCLLKRIIQILSFKCTH